MTPAPRPRIEVRSGSTWLALTPHGEAPSIFETDRLACRGLRSGSRLAVGPLASVAGSDGTAEIALTEEESLRGHLGLVEVRVDGRVEGEINIVPAKVSDGEYQALRADLERVWSGLVFDPEAANRLRASIPPPRELWRSIEDPVRQIMEQPRCEIRRVEGSRRLESARRPAELTPALVRAGATGRAGPSTLLVSAPTPADNGFVSDTLRRLQAYARRHPDGSEVSSTLSRLLRREPFRSAPLTVTVAPASARHDVRYRRVERVRRILDRPEAHPTEGPGELRLGVQGMVRLYEYWVFLQVLLAGQDLYGPPEPPGYQVLAAPLTGGRRRLELRAGTTVTFPGPVLVAFEPRITSRGDGWQGIEYVPHPDPDRQQTVATPDVVVFRPGPAPDLAVIDAKYVGRHWVEAAAADLHHKYARMRVAGVPVVRNVVAAHPHAGLSAQWSGYGHRPFVPGHPVDCRSLLP